MMRFAAAAVLAGWLCGAPDPGASGCGPGEGAEPADASSTACRGNAFASTPTVIRSPSPAPVTLRLLPSSGHAAILHRCSLKLKVLGPPPARVHSEQATCAASSTIAPTPQHARRWDAAAYYPDGRTDEEL